jgi:hypothetical protein
LPALLLILGCAGPQMTQTDLYFGLSRKDGLTVNDGQWQQFVDEEVTPRFPDGFTVTASQGQWRGPDGKIVRESSRVLTVLRSPDRGSDRKIDELRRIYRERFNQDAVMRVDDTAKVRF